MIPISNITMAFIKLAMAFAVALTALDRLRISTVEFFAIIVILFLVLSLMQAVADRVGSD